jgi:hypothetical protein
MAEPDGQAGFAPSAEEPFSTSSPGVFAGSGTTPMIAAEKAGRRGYGIEIDCHYTDIFLRRFDEV